MDLIRRSDAIAAFIHLSQGAMEGLIYKRTIDAIPAVDAVEVVRCRECKHNAQPPDKGFAQCELDALIREPEFWCRAGERREDET